ncbi:hypothetical protein COOONC_02588 [Cooperia oncophora]
MFPSFHVFCLMLAVTILSAEVSAAIDAKTIKKAKNGEWFSLPYDEDDRFLKIVTVSTIGSGDVSYENAQEYCRREGSYLMTIHSQADMNKITATFTSFCGFEEREQKGLEREITTVLAMRHTLINLSLLGWRIRKRDCYYRIEKSE